MKMENKNNNFAILALVAIVAVIGVVSLVMMMNSGSRNGVAMPGVAMTDGNTVAGHGFIGISKDLGKEVYARDLNVDDLTGNGDLSYSNAYSDCADRAGTWLENYDALTNYQNTEVSWHHYLVKLDRCDKMYSQFD